MSFYGCWLEVAWLQGGTYGGSIIGCAAANATIDAIEEDGMLDNALDRGVQLVQVSAAMCIPLLHSGPTSHMMQDHLVDAAHEQQ